MKYFHIIEDYKNELRLKNLAVTTIKSYTQHCLYFFQYYNKHPLDITEKELKQYILHLDDKDQSAKSRNLTIYSIKRYYNLMDKRSTVNIATHIPRQKVPRNLPSILSKADVVAMLTSMKNIKHRAILTIGYSSGLRINETRSLKISDVDSDRMTLLINGKGSRQRITPLCKEALLVLRSYYLQFKPKEWLFEGEGKKGPISARSLHNICKRALQLAGIRKNASFHTLRHCYATHQLEEGTNLHTIQKILGHKNIQSTLIYTHVAEEVIVKIKSPLTGIALPLTHELRGKKFPGGEK